MPNRSSIFNFKRSSPLAAVGIFLAAVVLLETALAFLPDDSLVQTFEGESLPSRAPDWQIMGDSVAQGGIIATQLTTYLPEGQFAYNLATAGTGPEFPYFQLQREIAAGVPPKAIIYAPAPHTFASQRVPLLVGGFCHWPEIVKVGEAGIEPLEVLYGIICKLSYTLRNREQISLLLKTDRREKAQIDPGTTTDNPPKDKSRPRWTTETLDARYRSPFSVQHFNEHFFRKFLQLAKAHHIPVYWVSVPVMPAVAECRRHYGFEPGYYRFLDDLQGSDQLRMLQREYLVWDEAHFKDQTHLTLAAARQFTKLLGEKLKELENDSAVIVATRP